MTTCTHCGAPMEDGYITTDGDGPWCSVAHVPAWAGELPDADDDDPYLFWTTFPATGKDSAEEGGDWYGDWDRTDRGRP